MRWRSLSIVVTALSIASGCNGVLRFVGPAVQGSGVAKEETREVDAFHAVEAGNALQVTVTVTQGAKPSLKLSGDDNVVPLVESEVKDGTLVLRVKDSSSISTKLPLKASVVTSELDRLKASGAADVKASVSSKLDQFTAESSGAARLSVDGLDTPKAVAIASSASHLTLSGTASSLKLDTSGKSRKGRGLEGRRRRRLDQRRLTHRPARHQERRRYAFGRFAAQPPRPPREEHRIRHGRFEREQQGLKPPSLSGQTPPLRPGAAAWPARLPELIVVRSINPSMSAPSAAASALPVRGPETRIHPTTRLFCRQSPRRRLAKSRPG